jgi:hypothetical protein
MALLSGDNAIEAISAERNAHYEPMGWHHWPEFPWLSYQFRRGLGETPVDGGAVSEVLLAASLMCSASTSLRCCAPARVR